MINDITLTILGFAIHIYTLLVLLRFLLQTAKADFYNPISQFIVKATNPVLMPLRKIVPGFFGVDFAAIVLAVLVQIVGMVLTHMLALGSIAPNPLLYLVLGILGTLTVLLDFFFFAIIILVIVSWISPGSRHDGTQLLHQVTEPLMRPIRNIVPSAGGLDFSPMIAMLILVILRSNVMPGVEAALLQIAR